MHTNYAWLKQADAAYPADWKIRLVLDNHSAHISKETRAYLATAPPLPTSLQGALDALSQKAVREPNGVPIDDNPLGPP